MLQRHLGYLAILQQSERDLEAGRHQAALEAAKVGKEIALPNSRLPQFEIPGASGPVVRRVSDRATARIRFAASIRYTEG